MNDPPVDDLYARFIHGYLERGDRQIPDDWPEELRRRCEVFVSLMDSRAASSSRRSVLAALAGEGIQPALTLTAEPPGDGEETTAVLDDDRYVVEREIGRGGMGRVLLVYDRDFRRRIAMKVLLGPDESKQLSSRFLEEAQATAQLEHPNITPVHDLGVDESGRPFFTMKWIHGRDLEEILRNHRDEFTLIRLVQILQGVAMGIDFAHDRGVIHRDLKPQNIMIGDFGEVLVMDWGVAKIIGAGAASAERVVTDRREHGGHTVDGSVIGSLPYMAPEQARGDSHAVDRRSDIYGLGALLYAILAGRPPRHGTTYEEFVEEARSGEVLAPREVDPSVPEELESICLRALEPRPEDRFQTAREFHDRLQQYVEGVHDAERRAAEGARRLEDAQAHETELRRLETEEAELRRRHDRLKAGVETYDPSDRKEPLWDVLRQLADCREQLAQRFNQTTAAYQAVLSIDPDNAAARAALADLFHDRLRSSEARGDFEATKLYEGLIEQFDDGRYESLLRGEGDLRLQTEPPGARVLLSRYRDTGVMLEESAPEELGPTPLERTVPMGSYVATLELPGHVAARYPFVIERCGSHRQRIRLHPAERVPEGFVQIPAGESAVGGSEDETQSLPRQRVRLDEFFVSRFPVTFGEYCSFLNEVLMPEAEQDPERRKLIPAFLPQEYVKRDSNGRFVPIDELTPAHPVVALTHDSMSEYCRWLGAKLGLAVRLPGELEWERCARGADGRIYPWGNGFDWSFCKGLRSRPEKPFPEEVGAFPKDSSPFGVHDLAGGVREFCAGLIDGKYRVCRGGSWYQPTPIACRADFRVFVERSARYVDIGFRTAYSL